MSIIVITGTNTDVGKTIATAAMAVQLKALGHKVTVLKPIQTGEPEGSGDAITIRHLCHPSGINSLDFLRYPEPLAPNLSARRAGMEQPKLKEVAEYILNLHGDLDRELGENAVLLVEGAGGLLVRMGDDWTLADLAQELDAPLVVVTSLGLGSLNSAELTVEAATRRGIKVLGLIGGSLKENPDLATRLNLRELVVVTKIPFMGAIPAGSGTLDPAQFAEMAAKQLDLEPVEAWLGG